MSLKIRPEYFQRFDVRLTVYYTFVCILLFIGIYTFFYYNLKGNLTGQIDSILKDEEHELIQELNDSAEAGLSVEAGCNRYMEDVSGRKYVPIYFRVFTSSKELLFEFSGPDNIPFPEFHKSSENISIDYGVFAPVRVHQTTATVRQLNETILIQLATVTTMSETILHQWVANAVTVVPLLLLTCIAGGFLVSLRPKRIIKKITNVTNRISSQNLTERLVVPDAKDEIRDLVITINSMLNRLDASFSQIKQFTADVSHELRNPLFALQGELEVALSKHRSPDEYADIISSCIVRIQFLFKMVKDLFMIASFDTNKIPLELSEIDLRGLLFEIHAFFLPMAQEKKVAFTVHVQERINLTADRTKLLQLLNNLIENAIKFTADGGTVELSAEVRHRCAHISIKDSGVGIPDEDLENVFNRFYQVDKSRSDFRNGAGLGLHICKRIAEIHGGVIQAKPNPVKGTTFVVALPLSGPSL